MADNKLAAGRKMLMEFQKRKTEKKHTSNTADLEKPNFSVEPNIPTIPNKIQPKEDFQIAPQEFIQLTNSPPDTFFDELSIKRQEEESLTTENGVPLAGMLFLPQSENQKDLEFFHSNDVINNEQPHDSILKNNTSNESVTLHSAVNETVEHEDVQDIKSLVEISKLQQQLQFHIKTVEFLVTEKNNLSERVDESEKIISDLKTQVTDLTGRLNISRHRVSQLETECSHLKQKNDATESQMAKLINNTSHYQSSETSYKKQLQDLQEELQDMKEMMEDKVSENLLLIQKCEKANIQLQSNELRLQQMMQGGGQMSINSSLQEHCQNLEQMVNTLRQQLTQEQSEKSHSNVHYQQYVQQLNNQVQMLNEKQEELINENERLQNHAESLLQQMGSLEKQLQTNYVQNVSQETSNKTNLQLTEKIQELESEISQLKVERESDKSILETASQEIKKKEEEIEELTSNIQRIQSESPDVTKLNAAIESDRLAAQKATAQNTKMKEDLHHLEKAFEQMTNSKLELAELLQAEKNMSKNLTMKLVETEEKLKEVESKLLAKDEEMIRLQAASSELEKEMLKHAQITDRINHYEAQGKSLELIQTELQSARNTIQGLTNENSKLKKLCAENKADHNEVIDSAEEALPNNTDEQPSDSFQENFNNTIITNIPTTDAMNKLQEKFTKLMKEVADLSDEKQKLEHIVLQLQGETETICEYIALYQKQRSILKQREAERNAQLNMLSKERELMKGQLENLKALVVELNNKKSPSSPEETNDPNIVSKIMDLVTEIKSNHLIEPNDNCTDLQNFHHCPWCSGKLITV